MRMTRRIAGLAAGAGTVVVAALGTVAPAQAYNNNELTIKEGRVLTRSDCFDFYGPLYATPVSGGCMMYDSADNTFFKHDPGGIAAKVELHKGGHMVGKVEFHPYSEKLWIYDTRDDGDTIYVSVGENGHAFSPSAGSSSGTIEYQVIDLNYPEGAQPSFYIWDERINGDGYDELDFTWGTA